MIARNPRISRWVLVLEMLVCFTPLTWLCLATFANLGRMDGKTGMVALTVAAAGPIGLVVAFKVVVLNRPSLTHSPWRRCAFSPHGQGSPIPYKFLRRPNPPLIGANSC